MEWLTAFKQQPDSDGVTEGFPVDSNTKTGTCVLVLSQ
jgi:hypothetical protein